MPSPLVHAAPVLPPTHIWCPWPVNDVHQHHHHDVQQSHHHAQVPHLGHSNHDALREWGGGGVEGVLVSGSGEGGDLRGGEAEL